MERNTRKLWYAAGLLLCFLFMLLAVKLIDVQPIGPKGSVVGLAALNGAVRDFFGVNLLWYHITDWLGVAAIAIALGFAVLGLGQLIRRKRLRAVDIDILLLGAFDIAAAAIYLLFEIFVVNYRPILMQANLEASFPSSHTMVVVYIMGTSLYQFLTRLKHRLLRLCAVGTSVLILTVTVLGRLICGVHWFTDILAGLLLSSALIFAYVGLCRKLKQKKASYSAIS